jgi:hypothetical protein
LSNLRRSKKYTRISSIQEELVMAVTSVSAFYCFDPADRALCQALDRHLAPLKHAGRIHIWDERQVLAGQEWERESDLQFSNARLLLLLISAGFLASETGRQQIQVALHRKQAGDVVVIPVLLRPCAWQETELRSLQMLPRNHKAITTQSNADKAWQEVVAEISHVLDSLLQCIYVISAPEDRDIMEHLSRDMTSCGVALWSVDPDQRSTDLTAARDAMRQASSVVLVASPAAFSSRVVKAQMELAATYQRPIQVVWVSGEDGSWSALGTWRAEAVFDARAQRYETATESLLASVKQPRATISSVEKQLQPATKPRNPYKGLQTFTAQDTRDFFGRDALINELTATLEHLLGQERKGKQDARLLAVLGASGSGKSSVVLAGLLPYLQQDGVLSSKEWIYLDPIVPGAHPLEALAVSFAQQPSLENVISLHTALTSDSLRVLHLLARQLAGSSSRKVLLFIDQFEEVFTLTTSEEERTHFLDLLLTAVTEPEGPFLVVLTMRADFYERSMQYPTFFRLLDAQHVSVLPMEPEELRQVIELPACLPDVQLTFEGDLVGDLLFDMREQVNALPLLEFTLDQLFAYRSDSMLTMRAYREIGGLKGALAKHTEATYRILPTKEHQIVARSLFLRLIDPGRTEQDTTRRRARLTEFDLPDPAQKKLIGETINTFLAARLLTTNEHAGIATIEVSHEALIREWPRLSEWLHEAREDILLQQKISEDALQWQQRRRPKDRLYRGSQLKEALAWAKRNTPSEQEDIFLHKSISRPAYSALFVLSLLLFILATTVGVSLFFRQRSPDLAQVTTLQNDGVGSLRWAIGNAASGSTISFAPSLAGQTIILTDTLEIPNKQLRLQGPGARRITISNAKHGIVVDDRASVTLTNLIFTGGKSNSVALFINMGNLTLTNSTVSDNSASQGGGGIYNSGSLTLTNSTVSDNSSEYGGGIYNSGSLTLTNSTVSDNSSEYGGGIFTYQRSLTLTNSTVSGNSASQSGGGIQNDNGSLTLTNSTVSGNSSIYGGGMGNDYGSLTLTNSTVSGNSASQNGGGIRNLAGAVTLVFCTLYGNQARTGGGLSTQDDATYDPSHPLHGVSTMSNSLIAGNQAHVGPDVAGVLTTEGYNLFQNTTGTTFLDPSQKHSTDLTDIPLSDIKINPNLQLNGSKTTETHALEPGSPAINAIPLAACLIIVSRVLITTDQRGVKRPQGPACDIGAYEYVPGTYLGEGF